MIGKICLAACGVVLASLATPALAHVGVSSTDSFSTGVLHPLSGLDHIMVMITVGLWATLKGGRAIWIWPPAFVGVMLVAGALAMAGLPIPFVEPGILASVVALGLLVALAVDIPVWLGAVIIGIFALFHGHAHGIEVPEAVMGVEYMAGFAIATACLHLVGIGFALGMARLRWRLVVRISGAICVLIGIGLATEVI